MKMTATKVMYGSLSGSSLKQDYFTALQVAHIAFKNKLQENGLSDEVIKSKLDALTTRGAQEGRSVVSALKQTKETPQALSATHAGNHETPSALMKVAVPGDTLSGVVVRHPDVIADARTAINSNAQCKRNGISDPMVAAVLATAVSSGANNIHHLPVNAPVMKPSAETTQLVVGAACNSGVKFIYAEVGKLDVSNPASWAKAGAAKIAAVVAMR